MADQPAPPPPSRRLTEILAAIRGSGGSDACTDAGDEPADLTHGLKAFMTGEFELAHRLLLPLAEGGEVRAQNVLARLYFAGNGVPRDLARYEHWLGRAAEGGDRTAKAKVKRLAKQRRGQRDDGAG